MLLFLTCKSKVELLCPDVVILDSAEQRLHLRYEQVWTVLPGFGHGADVLQEDSYELKKNIQHLHFYALYIFAIASISQKVSNITVWIFIKTLNI